MNSGGFFCLGLVNTMDSFVAHVSYLAKYFEMKRITMTVVGNCCQCCRSS